MNVLMRRLRPSLRPVINKHKYVRVSSNMNKEVVNPDGLTRFPSLGSPNGVLRGLDWIGFPITVLLIQSLINHQLIY